MDLSFLEGKLSQKIWSTCESGSQEFESGFQTEPKLGPYGEVC